MAKVCPLCRSEYADHLSSCPNCETVQRMPAVTKSDRDSGKPADLELTELGDANTLSGRSRFGNVRRGSGGTWEEDSLDPRTQPTEPEINLPSATHATEGSDDDTAQVDLADLFGEDHEPARRRHRVTNQSHPKNLRQVSTTLRTKRRPCGPCLRLDWMKKSMRLRRKMQRRRNWHLQRLQPTKQTRRHCSRMTRQLRPKTLSLLRVPLHLLISNQTMPMSILAKCRKNPKARKSAIRWLILVPPRAFTSMVPALTEEELGAEEPEEETQALEGFADEEAVEVPDDESEADDKETAPAVAKPRNGLRWVGGGLVGAAIGVAASVALSVYDILPIDDLKKMAGTAPVPAKDRARLANRNTAPHPGSSRSDRYRRAASAELRTSGGGSRQARCHQP